ncbi:MAG: LPS-assembly protein LptD [Deltaproteobacteria bacterium]|nr:LPS-assembly protein LptD [Deltaproteobacteria bacterium]
MQAQSTARAPSLAGSCVLSADQLSYNFNSQTICARNVVLADGFRRLSARRLRIGRDGQRGLVDGGVLELCRCALAVSASRIRLSPQRIHLRWPQLRVGGWPLLAAPYWAIARRPGTSGLLAPRFAYSPRDGVRFEQPIYLASGAADLTLAGGYVAGQGGLIRLKTTAYSSAVSLSLEQVSLATSQRLRSWQRARLFARGEALSLTLFTDLASDADLPRRLSWRAAEIFAPYRRSGIALGWRRSWFSLSLWSDLYSDAQPSVSRRALSGLSWLALAGRPRVLSDRLTLLLDGAGGLDAFASTSAAWRWRTVGSAGLGYADAWGALQVSAAARYRAQTERGADIAHDGAGGLQLALPLYRAFRQLTHHLAPQLGLRWRSGQPDEPRVAGLAALRNRLVGRRGRLASRFGLLSDGRQTRLAGLFEATAPVIRADLDLVWAMSQPRYHLDGGVCLGGTALGICGRYRRFRGQLLQQPLREGWSMVAMFGEYGLEQPALEIYPADALSWSLRLDAGPWHLRALVAFDAKNGRFGYGDGQLEWRFCGCLALGLRAAARQGQRLFDLGLILRLLPAAQALSCKLSYRSPSADQG